MREKISAMAVIGMTLSADLIAHPGHGPIELQATAWHWLLEPVHAVVAAAVLAVSCGLSWLTSRSFKLQVRGPGETAPQTDEKL